MIPCRLVTPTISSISIPGKRSNPQSKSVGKNERTKITNSNQSHKSYRKYNQRMGVHGPLNNSEVVSGAMEE
jgi:hypothetical protein